MPILDLSEARFSASLHLWSVMLHPANDDHRKRFLRLAVAAAADGLAYSDEAKSFTLDERLELHDLGFDGRFFEAAANDATKQINTQVGRIRKGFHPGRIAGQLIFIPMISYLNYSRDDIGRIQAIALLSDSKRNVQTLWSKYAPSAHLWAAWELAGMTDALLPLAASIGSWASQFVPKRSSGPLLNIPYWNVVPGVDLGTDYLREIVKPLNLCSTWRDQLHIDQ